MNLNLLHESGEEEGGLVLISAVNQFFGLVMMRVAKGLIRDSEYAGGSKDFSYNIRSSLEHTHLYKGNSQYFIA